MVILNVVLTWISHFVDNDLLFILYLYYTMKVVLHKKADLNDFFKKLLGCINFYSFGHGCMYCSMRVRGQLWGLITLSSCVSGHQARQHGLYLLTH